MKDAEKKIKIDKTITVEERKFKVSHSPSEEKWTAHEIAKLPSNNQLYALSSPWSCEAKSEEELDQKLNQYVETK